jgi:hypothetical protein
MDSNETLIFITASLPPAFSSSCLRFWDHAAPYAQFLYKRPWPRPLLSFGNYNDGIAKSARNANLFDISAPSVIVV